MLTDTQYNFVIISLVITIIILLFSKKELFQQVCSFGQCNTCSGDVYRKNFCYSSPVIRTCPQAISDPSNNYKLNNNTLLCDRTIMSEKKEYIDTVRPIFSCPEGQQILGESCVTLSISTFDPNYTKTVNNPSYMFNFLPSLTRSN